jgi:hypothetical protein
MEYHGDWNKEVVAQFYATLYVDEDHEGKESIFY